MGRRDYDGLAFLMIEVINMATLDVRDMHLIKKALAISVLVLEKQTGPFGSPNDLFDMKLLLERLMDIQELEHYMRSAQIAVTGKPPP